jgi:hypothetical protein
VKLGFQIYIGDDECDGGENNTEVCGYDGLEIASKNIAGCGVIKKTKEKRDDGALMYPRL